MAAVTCSTESAPSRLRCGSGVATVSVGAVVSTHARAALLHSDCIANVPVGSVTSPAGSMSPNAAPPRRTCGDFAAADRVGGVVPAGARERVGDRLGVFVPGDRGEPVPFAEVPLVDPVLTALVPRVELEGQVGEREAAGGGAHRGVPGAVATAARRGAAGAREAVREARAGRGRDDDLGVREVGDAEVRGIRRGLRAEVAPGHRVGRSGGVVDVPGQRFGAAGGDVLGGERGPGVRHGAETLVHADEEALGRAGGLARPVPPEHEVHAGRVLHQAAVVGEGTVGLRAGRCRLGADAGPEGWHDARDRPAGDVPGQPRELGVQVDDGRPGRGGRARSG